MVTAETGALPISSASYLSDVEISCSGSVEPVCVPVTVSVVAAPPGFIRLGVRPLAGFLLGALLGALIALLWRATGLVGDHNLLLWTTALAAVWGLAGGVRALRQPGAWPTRVALPRWLLKVLAWSAGLALLAAVIMEAWRLGLGGGLEFEGVSLAAAAAAGAAFGFAAATLDELAHSRHASDPGYVHGKRSSRRPVLFAVAGIVLVLAALLTPRVIATAGEPERGAGRGGARPGTGLRPAGTS